MAAPNVFKLEAYGSCTLDQDGCSTCGDVAIPVWVVTLEGTAALVEDRLGNRATIATDFIPEVRVEDILLVHLGVALTKLEASHEVRR